MELLVACASSNKTAKTLQLATRILVASKMATVAVGHIEEFRLDVEHITTFLERMELYFIANDIADAKKAAVLLTCIGGKRYRIVKSLLAPNLLISKSFPDLKEILMSHSTSTVEGNNLANQLLISLLSCVVDWL